MRRSAIITIGFSLGVIIAGAVNAVLVTLLPDGLRNAGIVWSTTALVTVLTIVVCWVLLAHRRP